MLRFRALFDEGTWVARVFSRQGLGSALGWERVADPLDRSDLLIAAWRAQLVGTQHADLFPAVKDGDFVAAVFDADMISG